MIILSLCPTHDSSVCVLVDGKLEFFCKEERITRIKRDMYPYASLSLCLEKYKYKMNHFIFSTPSNHEIDTSREVHRLIYKLFNPSEYKEIIKQNINIPNHHDCHAMLAYVNSRFDEALVFVIDRNGGSIVVENRLAARESESVYKFNKNNFYDLEKSYWITPTFSEKHKLISFLKNWHSDSNPIINVNNSLSVVKVYEAATTLIGQHPLENGKTMGLSAYGEYVNDDKIFKDSIPDESKFTHINGVISDGVTCFVKDIDVINDNLDQINYHYYANRAKQVQIETQEEVLKLIKKHIEKTGIKNVCLVGGYALNVVANNFYIKNLPDVNFYFEPNADDGGVSIGAAMLAHKQITGDYAKPLSDNFYHYFDDSESISVGKDSSLDEISNLLANGKSVAIFEGSPEAGPRALGHRSILFDPRIKNAKEIVNKIKKREWYRPFAGAILKSHFGEYFYNLGLSDSPYMTINFDAKEKTKELVPGIIHVDGTCRIQTVDKGFLFDLLSKFNQKTGCPMLLNTSFNLAGEALVQTKQDAINTLMNSSLDALYFVDENKLVTKNE